MGLGGAEKTPVEQQITYPLNNSRSMPGVGLGTWRAEPGQLKEVIRYALEEANYRHLDTAKAYGNEDAVGEALEEVCRCTRVFASCKSTVVHICEYLNTFQFSKVSRKYAEVVSTSCKIQLPVLFEVGNGRASAIVPLNQFPSRMAITFDFPTAADFQERQNQA